MAGERACSPVARKIGGPAMTTVDQIKDRWPLSAMLARLNITVPTRGKFRSPFRADNTPSCEIWKEAIKDWSTGELYDSIRCFAEAKGMSNPEAIKHLAAELPGAKQERPAHEKRDLVIPPLHWSHADAEKLAALRGIGVEGIHLAGAILGTLGFGKVGGFDCWILSDASRKLAEARRMSGKLFPAVGRLGERKSHTLRGSCKSWPLGIDPPKLKPHDRTPFLMVEGSPDYLAACDLASHSTRDFLPLAMLGAGQSIHKDALPLFRGREVVILAHPDEAGLESGKRWGAQLAQAGAKPTVIQLEGGDLNDLVKEHGADAAAKGLNL